MRLCDFRMDSASARIFISCLLLSCTFPARAASTMSELVIKNSVREGEVSGATLMEIISTATPTTQDERELILKLKIELLGQYLVANANKDKGPALALCVAVVKDAQELYGKENAKLIPVLRTAAKVYLRYKEPGRAIGLLTDAQRVSNIVYGPNDPATRFVLKELGHAYAAGGDTARSKHLIGRAEYLAKLAPASIEGITVLAATPPSLSDKPYQLVPVFFQTTRERTGEDDPQAFFGTRRASVSSFGVSYVSVPRQRESGSIPHASWLKLDFSTDPNRHVVLKAISPYDGVTDFLKAIRDRVKSSDRKESLIYIHGFNQSFQDGMESAATLAVDLEIDGSGGCQGSCRIFIVESGCF